MRWLCVILICGLLSACDHVGVPSPEGTRAVADSAQVDSVQNGVSITVKDDGEWGGVIEQ